MGGYGDFIRASPYTRTVDRKKLGFFYSQAIAEAERTGRSCADMRVVDLGAAAGAVALPLATLFGRVHAVDVDTVALSKLRSRAAQGGFTNVAVFESDAAAFDDAEPYDVVVASEVINLVPNPEALLTTIASLVRPGGLLLATVPNGYGAFELRNRHLNLRARLTRVDWIRRALGKPPHRSGASAGALHSFTFGRIVDRFRAHGFELTSTRNSDWLVPLVRSLRDGRLAELDCRVADRVPATLASGWYFAFRRTVGESRGERPREEVAAAPTPSPQSYSVRSAVAGSTAAALRAGT
jgi:SAM-dependent methyltransferase